MVVFACNNCGESLKKVQVAQHLGYSKCRGCSVSCMDCHRDFDLQAHVHHIKCITEEEKYSGGNYKPKVSVLNNERKREEWGKLIARVAADRSTPRTNNQQNLLDFLTSLESVPMKPKPFKALVTNGAPYHASAADSVWLMIEKEKDASMSLLQQKSNKPSAENNEKHSKKIEKEEKSVEEEIPKKKKKSKNKVEPEILEEEPKVKKNKKSKKEKVEEEEEQTEPKVKKNKKSKKEKVEEEEQTELKVKKNKKSKKETMEEVAEIVEEEPKVKKSKKSKKENVEEEVEVEEKKSKKKKKKDMNGTVENGHENGEVKKSKKRKVDEAEEKSTKKAKINESEVEEEKFSWKQAIQDVMSEKGNLSLKKLKRKVFAKYQEQPQVKELSEEKLDSKFNKMLKKCSNLTVENDKVILVQEV